MIYKPQAATTKHERLSVLLRGPDEREWWRKQLGKPLEAAGPKSALHLTGSAGR